MAETKIVSDRLDGSSEFTFQELALGDGTAANPALAFTSDPDTGLFNVGADNVGLSTGGTLRLDVDTSRVQSSLPMHLPDGTNANPSLSFFNDQDTGFYRHGTTNISTTIGGTSIFRVGAGSVQSNVAHFFSDGTAGSPSLSFFNDQDSGIFRNAANEISISLGGSFAYKFQDIEFIPGADNTTTCGKSTIRWSDVQSVLINGADIGFANNYILREYPCTEEDVQTKSPDWMKENANKGIQLINHLGETIMIFGQDGTIYAKDVKPLEEAPQ